MGRFGGALAEYAAASGDRQARVASPMAAYRKFHQPGDPPEIVTTAAAWVLNAGFTDKAHVNRRFLGLCERKDFMLPQF